MPIFLVYDQRSPRYIFCKISCWTNDASYFVSSVAHAGRLFANQRAYQSQDLTLEKYILQQLNYSMTLSQLFDIRNKVSWIYLCKYIQVFKQINILNTLVLKCKLSIIMDISCMQMIMPSF